MAGEVLDPEDQDKAEKPLKLLSEAITAFLVHCEYLNANTQRKYRNRLQKKLLPFCRQVGISMVPEVTIEVLDSYRATRKLALTTSRRELETLRQFFGFCAKRKWSDENAAKEIQPPCKAKPEEVVPYTREELDRMTEAAGRIGRGEYERKRATAMVMLLRYCALRISDIATLDRTRMKDGSILLYTKKTGGVVFLPIPPELEATLGALPVPHGADPGSKYFFINGKGSERTAVSVVERCLRSVFRLSGVVNARAHRFRHTLATQILTHGGTMRDVADVLGITEEVAEDHYQKWDEGRQNRILGVMRSLHAGTKLGRGLKLVVNR